MPTSEDFFHTSHLELLVPSFSSVPIQPEDPSSSSWWSDVQKSRARDTAYLDEDLEYYVGLAVDDDGSGRPSHELKHFLSRLQLTMTASFLPPMLRRPPPQPNTATANATVTNLNNQMLDPGLSPRPSGPNPDSSVNLDFPPVTPLPQPSVKDGEEQYAAAEGQVISETEITGKYKLYKDGDRWVAVWKGEVKIEFVRTQIRDPVLGLTASITLRDAPVKMGHKRGNFSIDTISTRAGGEDYDDEEAEYGGDGLARMEQMDLLSGLVDDSVGLPATRLGQSSRQDLSIPDPVSRLVPPLSAHIPDVSTPSWLSNDKSAATPSSVTLRKSYRRVLALHSGLVARMRTLCLPQLLPTTATDDDENEGEKKMALCIEIVNPENEGTVFEIEAINIEIAGNGGKATAELVCQPGQKPGEDLFPMRLQPVEQYNLLYGVSIAAAPDERANPGDQAVMRMMGRGDDTRPATIFVTARPCIPHDGEGEIEYPTKSFSTRWNSQLDLTSFYASLSNNTSVVPPNQQYRSSKTPVVPPNPVAGDKRYSIASFASPSESPSQKDSRRLTHRPILPGQIMAGRNQSMRQTSNAASSTEGLLVSVKLLPTAVGGGDSSRSSIKPFEPFSVEVFVHNRTEEVRRFRLSVPPRDGEAQIRETMDKRKSQHQSVQDDPVLRQMLTRYLASSPALIALEADVRCGPLLPGASLSARIRFMALREGVHKIEKLVVTGVGDDWSFVMSPVLDVIIA